jgi:hypothetical protein
LHQKLWKKTVELVNEYADLIISLVAQAESLKDYDGTLTGMSGVESIKVSKEFNVL